MIYRESHEDFFNRDEQSKIGKEASEAIQRVIGGNNAVGTLVGYYDEDLTILSVSEFLLFNLGYNFEEFQVFTKGSLKNLFYGDNTDFLDKDRFLQIQGMGEGEMLTKDGTPVTVRIFKGDSVDCDKRPIWIIAVRVDWEHENVTLINEALKSGFWYMDCNGKGEIQEVHWSHAFRKMLGFHDILDFPNELSSWSDLLHPEDRDKTLQHLRDAIADKSNLRKYDVEYRVRMQDGTYQWFRANAEIVRRLDGTARRITGIFVNIDSEKRAAILQKKMSADNAAMGHLIQSVTRLVDHFAICDLEENAYEYTSINIQGGYPSRGSYSELIGMVTDKFKTLSLSEPLQVILSAENLRQKLPDEKGIYKFEYCSTDESCYRSASIIPLNWENGRLTKVLWVSIDVTQEKERANRAKTEFLTNMSHDIRTPMNAIVGLTAIAGANIQYQDKVLECLGKITKASRHLLGLINEVLDMARIESGRISLEEEQFNLSELVDNLVTLIKPGIDEHRHSLEIHINNIEHEDVYGDTLRIQQMFTNLMSNAIKYTPDGGKIIFSIEEKKKVQSGLGCFQFCIEDNGIGMDENFQKIMFQPFTRADDKRTSRIPGTGLGMAITQNIVNMMNGDIQVESAPNKGTKITVTIFLKLQEKDENPVEELANLPVLVVDDDIYSCESTVATLSEIGIIGEWVTSGEEALARTFERHDRGEDYFAIILDWMMPEMDGIETTRQIRKRVGREVTIIVLTAYDYSEIEEEAIEAGVDAFITKPLFRSRLAATLKQILDGKPDQSAKDYLKEIRNVDYSDTRVLLAEDNELNAEIAAEIIGMTGAKVELARNGKEAVEKIEAAEEDRYSLVFMDIQMPVMNGYEATASIRALPGKRGQVPIVAMTANAFAEDVQLAKNTGMNGHIAKPLEIEKLNKILRKYLR